MLDYLRDADEIYRQSFATIRAEGPGKKYLIGHQASRALYTPARRRRRNARTYLHDYFCKKIVVP